MTKVLRVLIIIGLLCQLPFMSLEAKTKKKVQRKKAKTTKVVNSASQNNTKEDAPIIVAPTDFDAAGINPEGMGYEAAKAMYHPSNGHKGIDDRYYTIYNNASVEASYEEHFVAHFSIDKNKMPLLRGVILTVPKFYSGHVMQLAINDIGNDLMLVAYKVMGYRDDFVSLVLATYDKNGKLYDSMLAGILLPYNDFGFKTDLDWAFICSQTDEGYPKNMTSNLTVDFDKESTPYTFKVKRQTYYKADKDAKMITAYLAMTYMVDENGHFVRTDIEQKDMPTLNVANMKLLECSTAPRSDVNAFDTWNEITPELFKKNENVFGLYLKHLYERDMLLMLKWGYVNRDKSNINKLLPIVCRLNDDSNMRYYTAMTLSNAKSANVENYWRSIFNKTK